MHRLSKSKYISNIVCDPLHYPRLSSNMSQSLSFLSFLVSSLSFFQYLAVLSTLCLCVYNLNCQIGFKDLEWIRWNNIKELQKCHTELSWHAAWISDSGKCLLFQNSSINLWYLEPAVPQWIWLCTWVLLWAPEQRSQPQKKVASGKQKRGETQRIQMDSCQLKLQCWKFTSYQWQTPAYCSLTDKKMSFGAQT